MFGQLCNKATGSTRRLSSPTCRLRSSMSTTENGSLHPGIVGCRASQRQTSTARIFGRSDRSSFQCLLHAMSHKCTAIHSTMILQHAAASAEVLRSNELRMRRRTPTNKKTTVTSPRKNYQQQKKLKPGYIVLQHKSSVAITHNGHSRPSLHHQHCHSDV